MPGQDSDGMLASDGSEAIPALIAGNERGGSPASPAARARTRLRSPLGLRGFEVDKMNQSYAMAIWSGARQWR